MRLVPRGKGCFRGMAAPKTQYVSVGASDVAYQVLGTGSVDILYSYGLGRISMSRGTRRCLRCSWIGLASFSRLIIFDRRGTGASDGVPHQRDADVEEWTEDMLAVLDAAESERAAVFAPLDAGPIAVLFASLHPERVSALILLTTGARYLAADDYPAGASNDVVDGIVEMIEQTWGAPEFAELMLPNMSENPEFLDHVARDASCLGDATNRRGSVRLHSAHHRRSRGAPARPSAHVGTSRE